MLFVVYLLIGRFFVLLKVDPFFLCFGVRQESYPPLTREAEPQKNYILPPLSKHACVRARRNVHVIDAMQVTLQVPTAHEERG